MSPQDALASTFGPNAADLLPSFTRIALADGDVLFRDGEPADHLDVVLEGTLAVVLQVEDRSVAIATRGPGSWLGEVGLIDRGPATATVTASGPVELLRIDHAALVAMQQANPAAAAALLRHVSRQLAERIAHGSAGLVQRLDDGSLRLVAPEQQAHWLARVLGRFWGASS